MKRTSIALLAFMALLTGLAMDSHADRHRRYVQAKLSGTWSLDTVDKKGPMTFSSTGKVTRRVK